MDKRVIMNYYSDGKIDRKLSWVVLCPSWLTFRNVLQLSVIGSFVVPFSFLFILEGVFDVPLRRRAERYFVHIFSRMLINPLLRCTTSFHISIYLF